MKKNQIGPPNPNCQCSNRQPSDDPLTCQSCGGYLPDTGGTTVEDLQRLVAQRRKELGIHDA